MDNIVGRWSPEVEAKMKEITERYHFDVVFLPDGGLGTIGIQSGRHAISTLIPLFLIARFAECELEKEALKKELENHECVQSAKEEEKSQLVSQQE